MEFTQDQSLLQTPRFHKIKECIEALSKSGDVKNFAGNCVATADLVQTSLFRLGIASKIMECQVCIGRDINGVKSYMFVGYDNYSHSGQLDTHAVVITEGANPILIDLSIGDLLPTDHQYIIEYVTSPEAPTQNSEQSVKFIKTPLAEFNFGSFVVTYFEKKNLRLPGIHQKNLIQKLINIQNLEKQLAVFKWLIVSAIVLGSINFLLNLFTIILELFKLI